jgi:hypothetical protein
LREIQRQPLKAELMLWKRRTGWLKYFIAKDTVNIAKASHPPTKDERALSKVSQSIDRIFESCIGLM